MDMELPIRKGLGLDVSENNRGDQKTGNHKNISTPTNPPLNVVYPAR